MSTQKRVNVLIYAGAGAFLSSVRHATWSLRRLLGPHYSIQAVSSDQILNEPWPNTCALLVFPGGADMGYCRTLNGVGNRRIKQYVRMGGKYLGLCAGGYYGSSKCEFEVGKKGMEVVGDRELAFYPGTCRGLAFPGFVYQSEAGARAVELSISTTAFPHTVLDDFISYYNGGGVFVDAEKYKAQGVEVLASFHEELNVKAGEAKAAVVYCKVGEGAAVLTGPHPEFAGNNLDRTEESNPNYALLVDALLADDEKRTEFMKATLKRLGLEGMTLHSSSLPDPKATPHFNHHAYYANLKHFQAGQAGIAGDFGRVILYGEVVTSTQTILEKNTTWLSKLPIGTTCTATTQISGRGRGTNVWVSPPGTLAFSTVMKHLEVHSASAPVVFVQYLAALAIVAGIHNYEKGQGYEKLPIKLKWPNDIYALKPTSDPNREEYVKIGGILVNSSYSGGDFILIVGIGLNLDNAAPTTSINQLAAKQNLTPLAHEKLLASILTQFEFLYAKFCANGFDSTFENLYYRSWLHTDQIVTLDMAGNVKARIVGITRDYGLLVVEELETKKRITLQSDSNSFDFFKGLMKTKV